MVTFNCSSFKLLHAGCIFFLNILEIYGWTRIHNSIKCPLRTRLNKVKFEDLASYIKTLWVQIHRLGKITFK